MGQAGPHDQRPAVFQARTSSPKGWIMASKTEWSPITPNEEKTKRSFVGTGTRPANYPDANQYIEALVKRLTALHCPARIGSGPSPVSLRLDPASSCATKPDPQPAIPQYKELEFTAQALLLLVAGFKTSYRRKVEKRKKMGEYVRQYNPLWTNQTSAAIAKNLKLHPATQGIHQQEEETAPARQRGPDS